MLLTWKCYGQAYRRVVFELNNMLYLSLFIQFELYKIMNTNIEILLTAEVDTGGAQRHVTPC